MRVSNLFGCCSRARQPRPNPRTEKMASPDIVKSPSAIAISSPPAHPLPPSTAPNRSEWTLGGIIKGCLLILGAGAAIAWAVLPNLRAETCNSPNPIRPRVHPLGIPPYCPANLAPTGDTEYRVDSTTDVTLFSNTGFPRIPFGLATIESANALLFNMSGELHARCLNVTATPIDCQIIFGATDAHAARLNEQFYILRNSGDGALRTCARQVYDNQFKPYYDLHIKLNPAYQSFYNQTNTTQASLNATAFCLGQNFTQNPLPQTPLNLTDSCIKANFTLVPTPSIPFNLTELCPPSVNITHWVNITTPCPQQNDTATNGTFCPPSFNTTTWVNVTIPCPPPVNITTPCLPPNITEICPPSVNTTNYVNVTTPCPQQNVTATNGTSCPPSFNITNIVNTTFYVEVPGECPNSTTNVTLPCPIPRNISQGNDTVILLPPSISFAESLRSGTNPYLWVGGILGAFGSVLGYWTVNWTRGNPFFPDLSGPGATNFKFPKTASPNVGNRALRGIINKENTDAKGLNLDQALPVRNQLQLRGASVLMPSLIQGCYAGLTAAIAYNTLDRSDADRLMITHSFGAAATWTFNACRMAYGEG